MSDVTAETAAVKLCPPCRRGECEECLTPMREAAVNPYTCHTPGSGPCPRPAVSDREEPLDGYDFGIPGHDGEA